jgi:hypothetical protein
MRLFFDKILFVFLFLVIQEHPIDAANDISAGKPYFWEQEITTALIERNHAFSSLVPDSVGIDISLWNARLRTTILSNVSRVATNNSPWYTFIHGILLQSAGNESASNDFQQSLSFAMDDPGTTWLLFIEFNRYNLNAFSEKALVQLEKQMFREGATTARIIARYLCHYGIEQKIKNGKERALYLFSWAHRFDKNETASLLQTISISFPLHLNGLLNALRDYYDTISTSWIAQVSLFSPIYHFIRFCSIVFALSLFVAFSIKHFPKALHSLSHLYPDKVTIWLRTLLASCCIISLVCFGFIPFFCLVTFLLWQYLDRKETLLYSIILFLMVLSPFDAIITDRFQIVQNPEKPLAALAQAINEGPSGDPVVFDALAKKKNEEKRCDAITALFDAVKRSDMQRSLQLLHQTSPSPVNDPVTDNMKGIIYFIGGSIDSATYYFNKVVSYHPRDYCAKFNLSRCSIISNDATAGMDYLKQAAAINPLLVNTFVQNNDKYFNNNWPLLRQVLFPDYTPLQFWSTLFFPLTNNSASHRLQWGLAFLGFPPMVSFGLFIFLACFLIYQRIKLNSGRKPRRLFECKYCGRIICRKCTNGILCPLCSHSTQHLKGTMTLEQTRNKIVGLSSGLRSLCNAVCNLIIPGSGMLLDLQPHYLKAFILLMVSCFIYSWWYLVIGNTSMHWMTGTERFLLFLLPALFHVYALVRFGPIIIHQIKTLTVVASSPRGN